MKRSGNLMSKKINYDTKLVIRISKEEREAFKQYCQAKGLSISQALRDYMNQCVGGNR